jgi:hypothetical protein
MQIDEREATNGDVFRSVCSAELRPIFVVCADSLIAHEKIQDLYFGILFSQFRCRS